MVSYCQCQGHTTSLTPALLGNAELTDGTGRKWTYTGIAGTAKMEASVESMGGFTDRAKY